MKLDLEQLRSVLITIENAIQKPGDRIFFADDEDYAEFYHARQLYLAGCIAGKHWQSMEGETIIVTDLSPSGHDLLRKMRNDTVWARTKDRVRELGGQVPMKVLDKLLDAGWEQVIG